MAFTDDFILARQEPELRYEPNAADWEQKRAQTPEVYWRQGLYLGHMDRLIDIMIVQDGAKQRPITYGEFEDKARTDDAFKAALKPVQDVFLGFAFDTRPVMARVLFAHACLMRLTLFSFVRPLSLEDLVSAVPVFVKSDEAKNDIMWWKDHDEAVAQLVCAYLKNKLKRLSTENYEIPI